MKPISFLILFFVQSLFMLAQNQTPAYFLQPDLVFDGEMLQEGWAVIVENGYISAAGPTKDLSPPLGAELVRLKGLTLMPGLIEGHGHLFLHPYNETPWTDQVLKESEALRVVRATVHAKNTLMAGFTTLRDLGTEGAGYADVGLKQAIDQGIIPGPRLMVAGRAIVATGSYGPKGFAPEFDVPLGAEPADGQDLIRVVRDQIGHGADLIKVYADYRWGPNKEALPTFSQEELNLIVSTANSSGRSVVAHAATPEGMRRAIIAGVATIEHGDGGTPEIFELMKEKGVALCPTLAAGDAIHQYQGWRKGTDPEPIRIQNKKKSFQAALLAGVTICAGGDVGVFSHGDNVRELEMMVAYGMLTLEVLKSATSVNASLFHKNDQIGRVQVGLFADLIAVKGNPLVDISRLRQVDFVMKGGVIYKRE